MTRLALTPPIRRIRVPLARRWCRGIRARQMGETIEIDYRTMERKVTSGRLNRDEVKKHLSGLPDVSSKADNVEASLADRVQAPTAKTGARAPAKAQAKAPVKPPPKPSKPVGKKR